MGGQSRTSSLRQLRTWLCASICPWGHLRCQSGFTLITHMGIDGICNMIVVTVCLGSTQIGVALPLSSHHLSSTVIPEILKSHHLTSTVNPAVQFMVHAHLIALRPLPHLMALRPLPHLIALRPLPHLTALRNLPHPIALRLLLLMIYHLQSQHPKNWHIKAVQNSPTLILTSCWAPSFMWIPSCASAVRQRKSGRLSFIWFRKIVAA